MGAYQESRHYFRLAKPDLVLCSGGIWQKQNNTSFCPEALVYLCDIAGSYFCKRSEAEIDQWSFQKQNKTNKSKTKKSANQTESHAFTHLMIPSVSQLASQLASQSVSQSISSSQALGQLVNYSLMSVSP